MKNLPQIFGSLVFNDSVMKDRLPTETYVALQNTIKSGASLNLAVANIVANAMKDWAIELGATHFSHWFHPLTGITAEKHDAFIAPTRDGKIVMEFSGKELIKGESDASSFPSGGLRATFEARGYTAWDPTSPAFIKDTTLYIPTIFCSYTGEVLDKKIPLLRSIDTLDKATVKLLHLFPETANVSHVVPTVGAEQEYFLVDRNLYEKRKDLVFCGRTLFGAMPPKGQELADHYFGAIKTRVADYMKDLDEELWKLGILSKTKHNEAAPSQHELAPIFDPSNIATDHNQMIMETMRRLAPKHGFMCLLHEKPFAHVNGSGKHNNWSIQTDTGLNVFSPGPNPYQNKRFLLCFVAVMKAVDEYQDLLRLSIASAGNDQRLGAGEAPPAIISMYLGEDLAKIFESIETGKTFKEREKNQVELTDVIPEFTKDTADRNRTSPFAFTGNKFEFRMVGSSASIAGPNFVINTMVADVFNEFAEKLSKANDFNKAVNSLIKRTYIRHKRIVFNGNNYAMEWVEEAKKRGLSNDATTPESIPHFLDQKIVDLFERNKILTRDEIKTRVQVKMDSYSKTVNIEGSTLIDIFFKEILPSVVKYQKVLADTITSKITACGDIDVSTEKSILTYLSNYIANSYEIALKLKEDIVAARAVVGSKEKTMFYKDRVLVGMTNLRRIIDAMEVLVGEEYWPVPTYDKLLFSVNS